MRLSKLAQRLLLTLALVIGAALRFSALGFGLPHDLARPDEEKIILAALTVAGGDLNPHLFLYPSLFLYLVAAAFTATFAVLGSAVTATSYATGAVADPSVLHLVPRALSAGAGIATIAVLWAATRELFGTRAALAASFFLAVVYLHVRDAHFGTTDVPVALVVCCALWSAARCAARGATTRCLVVTGLLCGLATSTKYNAILVVAPAVVAAASRALAERRRPSRAEVASVALLLACVVVGFLAATPFALIDRPGFVAQFSEQQRIFAGIQNGSIIGPARAAFGGERGWIHYARFTLPNGVGLLLLFAALAGACRMMIERWQRAALALSFPLAYYASMGMGQLVYARNMVPIVPFVCLAAGVFVDRVAGLVARWSGSERLAVCGAVALVAALALPTAADSLAFDRLMARTDTRVQGARWLETHVRSGASVYQTGIFYGHLQPVPNERYRRADFDERRGVFVQQDHAAVWPEVAIRLDSPLRIYSRAPAALAAILERDYVLVQTFRAAPAGGDTQRLYDQQDAWYAPFANPGAADRPGPDVYIYRRR